jgi:hypothetical protein
MALFFCERFVPDGALTLEQFPSTAGNLTAIHWDCMNKRMSSLQSHSLHWLAILLDISFLRLPQICLLYNSSP